MAATAMTTSNSVASIGDMALLDFSILRTKLFTFLLSGNVLGRLFNLYEL
jgi:hypothetical protein